MGLFDDAFERVMGEVESAMDAEIQENVVPESKHLVHVKTGRLQRTIKGSAERNGSVVTGYVEAGDPDAPYARFQEFLHPFLRPGAATFSLQRVADRMKGGK